MRILVISVLLLIAGCGDSDDVIRKKAYTALSVDKDYATALKLYSKLANKGDALSQSQLGHMYSRGLGVNEDGKEAVAWWAKAAEQGNLSALSNVANAYKYGGSGVAQDYIEAIKWYEKCIAHSACFVELGDMHELGLGVQENPVEAARLYKLGASQEIKNPHSQLQMEVISKADSEMHLAQMYARGLGVQKDCAEAKRLMTLAANSNTVISEMASMKLREEFCTSEVGTKN